MGLVEDQCISRILYRLVVIYGPYLHVLRTRECATVGAREVSCIRSCMHRAALFLATRHDTLALKHTSSRTTSSSPPFPFTMLWHWRVPSSLILSVFLLPLCTSAANLFENTAIVRTVDLGGALVHLTTTYAIKALEDGSNVYTIALGEQEHGHTSWLEAKLKGQTERLPLEDFGYHKDRYVLCLSSLGKVSCNMDVLRYQRGLPLHRRAAEGSRREPNDESCD